MAGRIPNGTYVRVTGRAVRDENGEVIREGHTYIGRVIGMDMGHTKYKVEVRLPGFGKWFFSDSGAWAFPNEIEVISAEEALAMPEPVTEVA